MTRDDWQIQGLARSHRRDAFDCGSEDLNTYIRKYAWQNSKHDVCRVFVATYPEEELIRGFYTLSSSSVGHQDLPEDARKRLPRYPIPTALIGRLAVDHSAQGRGLGRELLMDGLYRVVRASEELGIHAIEVDAKDSKAQAFYAKYGFASLLDEPRHMFLSLKAAKKAFS